MKVGYGPGLWIWGPGLYAAETVKHPRFSPRLQISNNPTFAKVEECSDHKNDTRPLFFGGDEIYFSQSRTAMLLLKLSTISQITKGLFYILPGQQNPFPWR